MARPRSTLEMEIEEALETSRILFGGQQNKYVNNELLGFETQP
jgi:hypothetical protein